MLPKKNKYFQQLIPNTKKQLINNLRVYNTYSSVTEMPEISMLKPKEAWNLADEHKCWNQGSINY
mgnify:FL=1